jgi:hypothetical protein
VDSMDYDFTDIDKSYGTEYASLCCLLRAKRLDERCLVYVRDHPSGVVVNLGAGKESRFKLSTKVNMWGPDTLKMGMLVSVEWGQRGNPESGHGDRKFLTP